MQRLNAPVRVVSVPPTRYLRQGVGEGGPLNLAVEHVAVGQRHAELADPAAGSAVQRVEMPPVAPAEMPAGLTLVQGTRP